MSAQTGRVLGVDAGERRVGLALSDELRLLAAPVAVLTRGSTGLSTVMNEIATIAEREGVTRAVVGLPLNSDGSEGRQTRKARAFADILARTLSGIPVEMWDERSSTLDAEDLLRAQGRSMRKLRERGQIDAVAAAVILQDYLDAQRRDAERSRRLAEFGHEST